MANVNDQQRIVNANEFPCPCGSGKAIIDCCITARVNTTPPAPKSGYSNPKCYARQLNDCSHSMSKEHFVSEAVLNLIRLENKQLKISGPVWLDRNEERRISIESISSKILCKRHNQALSGLDIIGMKFFRFLLQENYSEEYLMINGDEVERWMLKLLCGQISSGWSSSEYRNWQPPKEWLEILFGLGNIQKCEGLYLFKGKDIKTDYHQIGAWLVGDGSQDVKFNGVYFLIGGFQFLFLISSPNNDFLERILKAGWQLHYRPECIIIVNGNTQREIHFGLPPRSGYYVMKVGPTS